MLVLHIYKVIKDLQLSQWIMIQLSNYCVSDRIAYTLYNISSWPFFLSCNFSLNVRFLLEFRLKWSQIRSNQSQSLLIEIDIDWNQAYKNILMETNNLRKKWRIVRRRKKREKTKRRRRRERRSISAVASKMVSNVLPFTFNALMHIHIQFHIYIEIQCPND